MPCRQFPSYMHVEGASLREISNDLFIFECQQYSYRLIIMEISNGLFTFECQQYRLIIVCPTTTLD